MNVTQTSSFFTASNLCWPSTNQPTGRTIADDLHGWKDLTRFHIVGISLNGDEIKTVNAINDLGINSNTCDFYVHHSLTSILQPPTVRLDVFGSTAWRRLPKCKSWLESDPLLPNEIICPYPKVQCVDCGMCDGKDSRFRKNIAVNVHGVRYKVNRYKGYRTQLELPVV